MKEEKKFELTTETKIVFGRKLFRIKALVDIEDRGVKKGDLGGFIEKESNLGGDAWVYGDAILTAKANFTKGWFIGGDDSGKITDIAEQTGSDYWENQYVLGDYEIKPIKEENTEEESDTKAEEFDPGMVVNRLDAIEKRLSKLEGSENG